MVVFIIVLAVIVFVFRHKLFDLLCLIFEKLDDFFIKNIIGKTKNTYDVRSNSLQEKRIGLHRFYVILLILFIFAILISSAITTCSNVNYVKRYIKQTDKYPSLTEKSKSYEIEQKKLKKLNESLESDYKRTKEVNDDLTLTGLEILNQVLEN